jgi:dTDP-glucose pyrophosphorylase
VLPRHSTIKIVNPNQKTAGAIASALLPYDRIDDCDAIALVPTNSLVAHGSLLEFMQAMLSSEHDAGVLLVESQNPNFSYVRMFEGKIIEFVEKKVVGNFATTGVFFFRNKDVLLNCARWALVNNQSTNNQYYVAPSLNYLLTSGRSIGYQVLTMDQYQHSSFPTEKG